MKKAIVLGGSKGIGLAISKSLKTIKLKVLATSRKEIDTSNIESVKSFIKKEKNTDILVLNTGGPPKKDFFEITESEWDMYYRQLFLSFCLILQNLKINKGGFIFLISSYYVKEPNPQMILSNSYRVAMVSVLKSLSKYYASKNINCITIALGPIKTDRLKNLVADMKALESSLPFKRAGKPEEVGDFVKSIIQNNIKYLNGATISFDGGHSSSLF